MNIQSTSCNEILLFYLKISGTPFTFVDFMKLTSHHQQLSMVLKPRLDLS